MYRLICEVANANFFYLDWKGKLNLNRPEGLIVKEEKEEGILNNVT